MTNNELQLEHEFDSSMTCNYCGIAEERTKLGEPCPERNRKPKPTPSPPAPIDNTPQFRRELTSVINRYSKENGSSTPDYILAEYLIGCLAAFDKAVVERAKWYGNSAGEGLERKMEATE